MCFARNVYLTLCRFIATFVMVLAGLPMPMQNPSLAGRCLRARPFPVTVGTIFHRYAMASTCA